MFDENMHYKYVSFNFQLGKYSILILIIIFLKLIDC
ncbi:hypothetical protein SAMN05428975_2903 [Mucilaginibacter sp. OK268]|nr:hypothetical protein SAMN05428975_2903 [Mucilaginibacter sp. OK268]